MYKESWLEEKRCRATFHSIRGLGSQKLRQLIAVYGSAQKAWENLETLGKSVLKEEPWISSLMQKAKGLNPQEIEEKLVAKGISTVIPEEAGYPSLLRELPDAPPLLYYKGHLCSDKEAIAVVGARRATPYGRAAAESISKELAASGIIVVSGLARGIDTAAHKGALAVKGITWAILGCGLDFMYPPENEKLAREIIDNKGALFTEFIPQTPPEPQFFPARNRLISGMSRGVVVVEAALKSGALITVDFALEQGREVFAVPGPIFSEQSKGSNNLLRQGAKIVESLKDITAELPSLVKSITVEKHFRGNVPLDSAPKVSSKQKEYTQEEQAIIDLFSDLPIHIDYITLNSQLAPEIIPLLLLELQLSGKIEQLPGQHYVLAHKC